MTQDTLSEQDDGKRVVNAYGEEIGVVSGVRNGVAYVDPDPGIGDQIMSVLGWDNIDAQDYPIDRSKIDVITDDEIRLKQEP